MSPPSPQEKLAVQGMLQALGHAPHTEAARAARLQFEEDHALVTSLLQPPERATLPPAILRQLQARSTQLWAERQQNPKTKNQGPRTQNQAGGVTPARRSFLLWAKAAAVIILGSLASLCLMPSRSVDMLITGTNSADPAQRYDVWLLPAGQPHETAPALYTQKGVRLPLTLSSMTQNTPTAASSARPYQLLICLANAGRCAGEPVALTLQAEVTAQPPDPVLMLEKLLRANRIEEAQRLLDALPDLTRDQPAILDLAKQVR